MSASCRRFTLVHPVTLAPMEEHTNYPFRLLMKQHGAPASSAPSRIDAADVARRGPPCPAAC